MKKFNLQYSIQRIILVLLIIAISGMFTACFFYKVKTSNKLVEQDVDAFNKKHKFFILHSGDKVWQIQQVKIKHDSLFGLLAPLIGHELYKTSKPKEANRYKYSKKEEDVIYEVHIYAASKQDNSKQLSIPVKDITKVEVYDLHVPVTVGTSILAFVGTGAVVAAVVAVIVLLTKQSCPFIYVSDGKNYNFCGEIYSGAIHKPIERHDYLKLSGLVADSGLFKLKITNEVKEQQFTNLAELLVIDHPENTDVLVDKYGQAQTFSQVQKPLTSINLKGDDILAKIGSKDLLAYSSDSTNKDSALTDGIILTFNQLGKSAKAKLIIRAKNTFWLDYLFGKFYDMFGVVYNSWMVRQDTASKQELLNWGLNQNIPLSIYIEKNGKWEFADYYNVIGPMAYKDDILSLDIDTNMHGPLKIKLEFGCNFWDIDYVALDSHENVPVTTKVVSLNTAINEKGEDVKSMLTADDSLYYSQPDISNYAMLSYSAPESTSNRRTVILHSKGHYRILRNPSGIPNKKYLEEFNKPGRFNQFSNELRTNLNISK